MIGTADHPRMALKAFRPMAKGSLRGFATVRLPIRLLIADCRGCGSRGASLPAKPILDRDGRHVEENGKRKYAPIPSADRWSAAVVELVRQRIPPQSR